MIFFNNFVFLYLDDISIFSPDHWWTWGSRSSGAGAKAPPSTLCWSRQVRVPPGNCVFSWVYYLTRAGKDGPRESQCSSIIACTCWLVTTPAYFRFYQFLPPLHPKQQPGYNLHTSPHGITNSLGPLRLKLPSALSGPDVSLRPSSSLLSMIQGRPFPALFWGSLLCFRSPKTLQKLVEMNYDGGNCEPLAVEVALEEWRHWLEEVEQPFLDWTTQILSTSGPRLNCQQAQWAFFFSRLTWACPITPDQARQSQSHKSLSQVMFPGTKVLRSPGGDLGCWKWSTLGSDS